MKKKVVLCLSGGGFRATYFHLGVVRWMLETGLLDSTRAIYSVSGGSILASHLARNWTQITQAGADEPPKERLAAFDRIADELVKFGLSDVRGRVVRRWFIWTLTFGLIAYPFRKVRGLKGQLTRFRITGLLEREYARLLTRDWCFSDQTVADAPAFNLLATSLTTGELCVLSAEGVRRIASGSGESYLMEKRPPSAALMTAASSAFPPLFTPVELTSEFLGKESPEMMGTDPLQLTDGGVYDNIGLGVALRDAYAAGLADQVTFVVSDASAPFDWEEGVSFTDPLSRTVRTTDILMRRVAEFEEQTSIELAGKDVIRVSIDETSTGLSADGALPKPIQHALSNIRTDLDRFSRVEMGALATHGYTLAHSKMHSHVSGDGGRPWAPPATLASLKATRGPLLRHLDSAAKRKLFHFTLTDWTFYVCILYGAAILISMWLAGNALYFKRSDKESINASIRLNEDHIAKLQETNASLSNEVFSLRESLSAAQCQVRPAKDATPPPPAKVGRQQEVISITSNERPSGLGRSYSEPYELCSPVLKEGQRIVASEFRLEGDRACGAWSECKPTVTTPQRVCWQFRLQGHDEWFPPRPAFSSGVLTLTLETTTN
ncbi:patatin-like phospholipase family protein [Aquincola tertiaricarbonis]|uniref:Patatin-like phospholipase family protein n=1 Tax=Aquincola tertiaricarbonis TaxID=391953 RepID=A0ABY4SHN3_AQUTE|nr:patatin-like phospholipase family protein [Aquincola tertiaricarbonis]URI11642.1 patatin-like phospholipase family protein [Aquincola tertiaricarbonis]